MIYMIDLTYLLTILVKSSLDATIAIIKTQFISINNQPPIYKTNLQQYLQKNPFYNNHISDNIVHFAKAIVQNPKKLPLQKSILSLYGIEKLKLLCEYFGNQKHKSNGIIVQPLINSSECKKEWQMVKYMKLMKNYNIIKGWHHVWSTCFQFKNQFSNINILVNIVLLVLLLNANVERVFSQYKLIKTRLLDMYLTILLNAPDNIEDFNWDKAFNQ
ncbi:hypothetical protein RhiirC2_792466 [Rhizophagus irregularis]|uniref:HAT C-terminal dimerisation domain-containing protein n=1 Tax=Rhizophagus irregularis TaxID=588596 RepID=A0A2N1MHA8_9GLOM|nr:hypothetical protein RhiirC2_792466 [Rhizophagus irregularis]